MELINTTKFPNHFLRRLLSFICKQVEVSPRSIKEARFGYTTWIYKGKCWNYSRHMIVTVNKNEDCFPHDDLKDQLEALVFITGHETAHMRHGDHQWRNRTKRPRELNADHLASICLNEFRKNRDHLLTLWNKEPAYAKTEKPKANLKQRNAEKALSYLKKWERKLKIAKTKVKKYQTQVKRYKKEGVL